MDDKEFLKRLKRGDPLAQKQLYDTYAPKMLGIAMRYASSREEAEDILQEAFVKIFKNIDKFESRGSFEGWMIRILINTAIIKYHKEKKHRYQYDITEIKETDIDNFDTTDPDFTMDEIMQAIQSLPPGYRTVFNLYAIEGYKHKEIAQILNIDVSTSKSQYHRAKKLLQKKLIQLKNYRLKNNGKL